jgi:hypothetical protein
MLRTLDVCLELDRGVENYPHCIDMDKANNSSLIAISKSKNKNFG